MGKTNHTELPQKKFELGFNRKNSHEQVIVNIDRDHMKKSSLCFIMFELPSGYIIYSFLAHFLWTDKNRNEMKI